METNVGQKDTSLNAISGSIWVLTVFSYVLVSLLTRAWDITWVIFLVAAAITNLINAIMMK